MTQRLVGRPPKGIVRSIDVACAHCGVPVRRNIAHVKKRVFCSNRCHGDSKTGRVVHAADTLRALSARFSGTGNPNWKGGPERNLALYKLWCERNRESINQRGANRRALKRRAPGYFTKEQWEELKQASGYRCVGCGKAEPDIRLTRDHIIPLSKGGWNSIDNIQPLCLSCNCKKKDRVVPDLIPDTQIRERVQRAIEISRSRPSRKHTPETLAKVRCRGKKLTKTSVLAIVAVKWTEPAAVVAKRFDVGKKTILDIWHGRTWRFPDESDTARIDSVADRRAAGHLIVGKRNQCAKFSDELVYLVRQDSGTLKEIGRRFGISAPHVRQLRLGFQRKELHINVEKCRKLGAELGIVIPDPGEVAA